MPIKLRHISRKNLIYVIISIDEEKTFDKIQHLFMIISLRKLSVRPGLQSQLRIFALGTGYQSLHSGVPFVAQRLTNPTRIHEDAGLIPGLAQWFKDPAMT